MSFQKQHMAVCVLTLERCVGNVPHNSSVIYSGALHLYPGLELQECPDLTYSFTLEQVEVVNWALMNYACFTYPTLIIRFQHTFQRACNRDLLENGTLKAELKLKQYEDNMHNYCCR